MKIRSKLVLFSFLLLVLSACSNSDPGPLAGTWQLQGMFPMKIHFRDGECESMGLIEKVSYEIKGNEVRVTSENGPMKGIAARYIMLTPTTMKTEAGTFWRVE